ncbi:AAA family ATPase [Desulfurobacterium thermolithotrophum]|uniref:AAA family ATPase n=1 Tax=Desulfurobacterium thermolithotrophum TaxID=64160 RepID=UPI0013D36053|nr:AAA family ATPase [Desulfurobacterium thermolithotrophum]
MANQVEKLVKLVKDKHSSSIDSKCKVLSFVSGKGGVGKTNISVSLAYILSNIFFKKVLLLDGDIGLGNIHILLGLQPEKNLKKVLTGEQLKNIIQRIYNFDVLLGFSGIDTIDDLESINTANLFLQLNEILDSYDYILIDNSAGLNRNTLGFSRVSTTTYVVTTPEPTALTDAYAFIKSTYKLYGYKNFKVIVNMCRSQSEGYETFNRLQFSCKNFLGISIKLAGIVPASKNIKKSLIKKKLIVKDYPADPFSLELKKIAQLETGETFPPQKESFISKLLRVFKEGR